MDDTDKIQHCQHCGKPMGDKSIQGLCPACLMKAGWPTSEEAEPGGFEPPAIEDVARLFPQLEILELIGRGGMGAVYKARQPDLDRLVALKILARKSDSDLGFTERFTREARALAKLSHPNIVGVHDFGHRSFCGKPIVGQSPSENSGGAAGEAGDVERIVDGAQQSQMNLQPGDAREVSHTSSDLSYFIMEFVDGPNLRQIEKAGQLSPKEALEIIPQICAALQFAHDAGVVHRDIKPENILLDQKGRVKIADFGLAKIMGTERTSFTLTEPNHVMGTPHYMAPEQVEHPKDVDHRADIYSLGVVFYEMLTGELPLGKFAPPSRKVAMDVRLDEVVLRTLEKEPELRYQQVSQVRTEVQTIAATPGQSAGGTHSKASPCHISTPKHLRSLRGRFFYIYQGKGQLRLDGESLSFRRRWQAVTIPLSSITRLAQGEYPFTANLHFIAVTFEEQGFSRTLLFTPCKKEILPPTETNKIGAQWMSDLKEAIRIRVGRTLSVERLDVTQKTSCWEFVTLFLFVAACTTVSVSLFPFIAYHRLPNRFHELFPAIIGMPMLLLSTMMVRRLGWLTDQVHCRRSRVEKDSMSEAKMCQQGPLALTHEEMVDCFKATGFHAILMIAMMGLIIFVAPQFYALFSDSAIALPKMTAVTIGLFDVIQRFGLILIPVLLAIDFGIGFSLRHCLRRPAFRVYSFVCSILLVLIPLIMFGILALSTQDVLMASRQLKQTQQGDPFMAHLSQGSIELVGVSSDSGEGNIWWKPDGSLSEVSFVTSKSGLSMSSDTQIRQFVLSFRDFTEDQLARMAWKYDLVSSGGGTGPITYTGDKEFGLLKMRSASLPVSAKTVTISVGLGLDAWETVAQYRGDVGNEIELTHQGNRWMLHFFPPAKSDGNIQVTVVHNIKDWQYRFVAVDTREVIHEAHMTGDTTSQTNAQAVFKDIQMSDIQNFQFQVRPYHWATFTGVALQPRSDVLRNAGEALFQSHQKKALVDFNDPSFWRTQIKRHLEGVRTLDCELITDRLVYEADANTPESRVRQQYSLKWDRDHRWIDCAVTDVERNLLKNRIIQGDQFGWSLRANTWTKVKAGSGGFLMSQFSNFGEMRSQPYQHAFSVAKGILCSDTIQRTQVQGVIDWNQIEMVHSVDDQKRHVLKHSMPMPGPEGQMLTADMVLIGTWEQGAFKLLELRGQCLALDMDLLAEAYSEHVFVDGLWVPQRAEMSEWTDPQAGAPPRLQEKTTVTVQRISVNQPMTAAIFDGFEPPVGVRVDNQLTGKNYRVWPDLDQIKASGGKVWVSVKGRVYLDGKPSVGAIVTTAVFDDPNEAIGHTVSATSDEKGEFELKSLMPGLEYMVQAQDQAGHTVSQPAQLSELGEDYTGLKLDMTSGLTATGTVTDPNGLPLAQARVQFSGKSMVETDDQGRYAVNGLYADQRYEVKAVARGFAPLDPGSESSVANYEIVLGDEGEPEPFNIVLQKEWILSGRVVDQDSQPVSGVRVMVWSSPFGTGDLWQWYDTRTDQEGKFSVGNLGDRIYTFFVGQYGNVCHSPLESPILFRVTGDSFMPNPLPGRGLVPPEIVTGVETFELPYRQFFRLREYSEASRQNKGGKLLSQWIEQLYTADHAGRCEVLARLGSVPAYHALDTFELILSGRKIQDARGSGTFTTFGSNMASATEPGPCPEDLVNCQDKGIVCLAMRAVARTGFVGEHAGLLIDKLDDPNALVRDTALVALAELTGVYVGDEKTQWQDWLKQYQDARSSLDTRGNFPLIESLCQLCRQDEWSKQGIECMMAAWQGASEGASRFRKQLEGDEGKAIWAFFASVDLNGDDPIRRGHPFGYWPSDIFRSQGHQNYDLKFRVARSCTLGSQVFEPNVWYCLPALFRDGFQGQWEIVDLRLDDIERDASSK